MNTENTKFKPEDFGWTSKNQEEASFFASHLNDLPEATKEIILKFGKSKQIKGIDKGMAHPIKPQ